MWDATLNLQLQSKEVWRWLYIWFHDGDVNFKMVYICSEVVFESWDEDNHQEQRIPILISHNSDLEYFLSKVGLCCISWLKKILGNLWISMSLAREYVSFKHLREREKWNWQHFTTASYMNQICRKAAAKNISIRFSFVCFILLERWKKQIMKWIVEVKCVASWSCGPGQTQLCFFFKLNQIKLASGNGGCDWFFSTDAQQSRAKPCLA